MAWKYVIESHGYVYTDAAGKICGKVGEAWEGEWWAEAGNKHLGNYVDRDSAKRAVEQAFKGRY